VSVLHHELAAFFRWKSIRLRALASLAPAGLFPLARADEVIE